MNLVDDDYEVVERGVWLGVKGFSIRVINTDEGVECHFCNSVFRLPELMQ